MEQPKKNRCFHSDCKKKLSLCDITCKCKERFCSQHRLPEDHACTYDFKKAGKTELENSMPKVDGNKLDKI